MKTHELRQANEKRCLECLFEYGELSRAQLANALHLTRATLTNVTASLLKQGLIEETGLVTGEGKAGRPGKLLRLVGDSAYFVGIGLGRSHHALVILNLCGDIVSCACLSTPDEAAADHIISEIAEMLLTYLGEKDHTIERLKAIGVALPGVIDKFGNVINGAPQAWGDFNISELVKRHTGLMRKTRLYNDANAGAFAAYLDQIPDQRHDVMVLFLEEGIGAGFVHEGKLFLGNDGFAGEVGQMILAVSDQSGDRPITLEELVGLPALLRQAGQPSLQALCKALKREDEKVTSAVIHWAGLLGMGIASIANVLNCRKIVLAGALAPIAERVLAFISNAVLKGLYANVPPPSIQLSTNPDTLCALGAARLVLANYMT